MGVSVFQRPMPVRMGVWLAGWIVRIVLMLMVRVMAVAVGVRRFHMCMIMNMALGEMEPGAERHQKSRKKDCSRERGSKDEGRRNGADKGCGAVIGAGPGGTQMPERHNEEDKSQSVTDETKRHGACNVS